MSQGVIKQLRSLVFIEGRQRLVRADKEMYIFRLEKCYMWLTAIQKNNPSFDEESPNI